MQLRDDPRLDVPSHYDREAICEIMLDFWRFLASMPPFAEKDVLIPPSRGWPQITEVSFAPLQKNAAVIDLLQHLPYMNMESQKYQFAPGPTQPLDYRSPLFIQTLETNTFHGAARWSQAPHGPYPEWVIPVATGVIRGEYAMLDTTDGTITRQVNAMGAFDPTYDPEDPRSWRDKCTDDTKDAATYFDELKQYFLRSEWLPYWLDGRFKLSMQGEDKDSHVELVHIYQRHGWPSHFDRERCKAELLELDATNTT